MARVSERILIGFVALVAATGLLLVTPTPALASCNAHHNIAGGSKPAGMERRGVRVNNLNVHDRLVVCLLVMDVDMYQDDFNQIENGWMDLYDQSGVDQTCQYSHGANPPPHWAIIVTYHGTQGCEASNNTYTTGYHSMRLKWDSNCLDQAGYDAFVDGSLVVYCNFSDFGSNNLALPLTNAERYGGTDQMVEDFADLSYETSGGLQPFDAYKVCDSDSDYDQTITSATEINIVAGSGSPYCSL